MSHLSRFLACAAPVFALLALPATARPAAPSLRYTLAMPAPQTHYFEVRLELHGLAQDYTDVKMPVWAPGSYLVREFAQNVEGLRAVGTADLPLAVEKIDKNTWRVRHPRQSDLRIEYRVYAFEISVRTSFIDADHGYLNGSSVFVYPALGKSLGSTLTVQPAPNWGQVSTALRPAPGAAAFTYQVRDYDELADSPIEIGNQKVLRFMAADTPHEVAMSGTYQVDESRLLADLKRICETTQRVVGRNPLDRYLFIVHNVDHEAGGLEHSSSATLEVSRATYATEAGYQAFLRLAAHEYFHLWNVKRIRPIALGPFDYDRENYTHMLWVSEGMTEYMANLIGRRAGYISQQGYLDYLAGSIEALENTPGNKVQSAAEASFDAWIKYYRPNENSANSEVSYYDKGKAIGLVLDLMIIQATQGRQHLDDVFRLLYDTYYAKRGRGFTDQEFQDAVATVAGQRFDAFFQNHVYGTLPLDYATALGFAGLALSAPPANPNGAMGVRASRGGRHVVTGVDRNGAAWAGGLSVNDEIVQINGAPITESELRQQLGGLPVGANVTLQIRRDGLLRDITLTLRASPAMRYQLQPVPVATANQQQVLSKWLTDNP